MPIEFPDNRKEVVDRVKTDIQLALPDSDPFLPKSMEGALATGTGGRDYDIYLNLKELLLQMFPDTATGEFLVRWGSYKNIYPNPATVSTGVVVVFGTVGTVIPTATSLSSLPGFIYITQVTKTINAISLAIASLSRSGSLVTATTTDEHFLATGQQITISGANETQYNGTFTIIANSQTSFTYTIATTPATPATGTIVGTYDGALLTVSSQATGAAVNLENGSQLNLTTPIIGANSPLLVTETDVSGGTDAETTEAYRQRVLFAYKNPIAEFNKNQLELIAKSIAGVTRVWVFEVTPFVGYVSLYFTRDNDVDSILPDPSEISTVREAILAVKPSNMDNSQLIVDSPTPVPVDFVFTSITPDTPEMRSAITSTLEFLFRDIAINVAVSVPVITYNSAIINTIDSTGTRLVSFVLASPTTDITIVLPELAVLNSITFL